ncbi:MAG TPA: monovalent cation/H(+) antiporter subunit G [Candidatus Dietzia intestinipullorum]|nr:monovalent cation/H(+) antiporter subunit G [Candidatus Dietzia intestinipullorum]
MTDDILEIISALFVFAGALLTLGSAIGLVRFRDTLSRMHPAAKPQVLGLVLVLFGAIVRIFPHIDVGMLVLTAIVAVCTAPVIANRVGNLAYRESVEDGTVTHEAPPAETDSAAETESRPASDEPDRRP